MVFLTQVAVAVVVVVALAQTDSQSSSSSTRTLSPYELPSPDRPPSRTAVCLVGELRSIALTGPGLRQHLLDQLGARSPARPISSLRRVLLAELRTANGCVGAVQAPMPSWSASRESLRPSPTSTCSSPSALDLCTRPWGQTRRPATSNEHQPLPPTVLWHP
jgi:hypothetical protein